MYDTSDIRKGLKVLMDGNPYTVIEFQFVKPGKGAAFTRTKFKNLLTGESSSATSARARSSSPRTSRARDAVPLQGGRRSRVHGPEHYEQVTVRAEMIGDAPDLLKDNMPCTVLFFNGAPIGDDAAHFRVSRCTRSRPVQRRHRDGATKPATVETGATDRRAAVHQRRRPDQDRYAHYEYVERVSRA